MLAAVLLTSFVGAGAIVFTPCEFAAELSKPEHKVDFWQIPTWVCLAHHASGLNTRYKHWRNYFGIFRISSYWCSRCGFNCSDLEDDDVTKDIDCAVNVVYKEHGGSQGGFQGWGDWYTDYCSKPWRSLENFDCTLEPIGIDNSTLEPIDIDNSTLEPIGIDNSTLEPIGIDNSDPLIPKNNSSSSAISSKTKNFNSTTSNLGYLNSESSYFWSDFLSITLLCSAYLFIIIFVIFLYRSNLYERIVEL